MNEPHRIARPIPAFDSRPDLPVALVIGAGGLGMAIAQRLGQSHRLAIASLVEAELAAARERLHELGVVSTTLSCDITVPASVAELATAVADLGPVQTLAHVAAVSPAGADRHRIFNVNLVGAARIERALLPLMADGGVGIFISSSGGHRPAPDKSIRALLDDPLADDLIARLKTELGKDAGAGAAYSLSKWALNRYIRRRAVPWGRRRCRLLTISPGLIDTEMAAAADADTCGETKAAMRGKIPLGRDGTMAEIADAVEFLASPRARYITGTDLLIDGGLIAGLLFPDEAP